MLAVASALLSITCFLLAGFIFKNAHSLLHRLWAYFNISVGIWGAGIFFSSIAHTPQDAFRSWQFAHCGGFFVPVFFYHVTHDFCNCKGKVFLYFVYAQATIFFVLNLFGQAGYRVEPTFGPIYYVKADSFIYVIVTILWFLPVIYGHFVLFKSYRHATGPRKNQIKYLLASMLVGFGGGALHFLPVYNINIYPYGNFSITIYTLIATYAIFKHRLLEIEVIIKRTLVFAGLFLMVMLVVAGITALTRSFLGQFIKIPQEASMTFAVMIAIALYDPARKFLVNLTDRFLFQKKFRLSSIVAQASYAIAFVQSLKWLARRIVAFLVLKCRIKHAVVYIRSDATGSFIRGALRGYPADPQPPATLPETHMMIRYLYESRAAIEIRRLEELMDKNPNHLARTGLEMVYEFLKAARAEVVIPSFLRRRIDEAGMGKEMSTKRERDEGMVLRNILILGGKKSDEPYSDEDLEVFYSLAQESAIAIENARLFDEAVEKTKLLADMNRELGDMNSKLQVTQASLIVAEKNATMVGMAQAIGHEVNNPLTTVLMRTDIVYRDKIKKFKGILEEVKGKMTEEEFAKVMKSITVIEDDIGRASRSAHRINAVVHTLTDILRDTKGEMGSLSLRVLFHEALEATRFSTYEENLAGCDIKLEVASNVMIRGNLEQLLQVFINLIKNAYEAMDKSKDRRIQIQGDVDTEDPKMARIVVIDNGPGIPPDVLPRIWGQGFSTKQKKDDSIGAAGQGQGLFICKHMIESVHRGSVVCESEVGKGTRFIIKLPLAEMEITYTEPTAS